MSYYINILLLLGESIIPIRQDSRLMNVNSINGDQLINILESTTPYDEDYLLHVGLHNEGIYINNLEVVGKILFSEKNTVDHFTSFNQVIFKTHVIFAGTIFKNSIRFNDCTFEERVTIGGLILYIDGKDNKNSPTTFLQELLFKGCTFKKGLAILGGHFNSFYTSDCDFPKDTSRIINLEDSIYIQGGLFRQGFAIFGGTVDNNITINGGYFEKELHFAGGLEVKSYIDIADGYISKLGVDNVKINKMRIRSSKRNYFPEINIGSGIKRLEISPIQQSDSQKNLILKKLTFTASPDSTMIGIGCIIQECIFNNYDSSSTNTISIYQAVIENLCFIDFNNYGKITFIDLKNRKNNSTILCQRTNLGTVDFISCDLTKYEMFVDDCKLINIFYTSTKLPNKIKSMKEGIEMVRQLRDTYDQLQTVASKQGDRVSSLRWQHNSLQYYFSSLTPFERRWWILLFMRISNNFRMSSALGLLFTSITAAILFYFYLLAYTGQSIRNLTNDKQRTTFEKFYSYYFEFINPAHRVDFIGREAHDPLLANFIDLLGRLLIGFGIYQTIQAFRRFGKGD